VQDNRSRLGTGPGLDDTEANQESLQEVKHPPFLLEIKEAGQSLSGKTKIFLVYNDGGEELGEIKWFSHWRQYCFYQLDGVVMSAECLDKIASFLHKQNRDHRDNLSIRKR